MIFVHHIHSDTEPISLSYQDGEVVDIHFFIKTSEVIITVDQGTALDLHNMLGMWLESGGVSEPDFGDPS